VRRFGRSTVSEFLADRIVYRNLIPSDPRLPPLDTLREQAGLPPGLLPRKSEVEYGQVIARLLRQARLLDAPGTAIQRLLFVGDTHLLDGTAFENICLAGGWPGLAFIGSENDKQLSAEIFPTPSGQALYLANRWAALADFDRYCAGHGFPVDEATAVVIDLDKTAIGARGRNARAIDQARVDAVEKTVSSLLGAAFDLPAFRRDYDLLNQPEFHPFTADNQDYLAYVCLALGSGLYEPDSLVAQVRAGELKSFAQFINQVNQRTAYLPPGLAEIHAEIFAAVQAGDPTPFKAFRRNEYLLTVGRMGCLADNAPLETLLRDEIVITQEVRLQALEWWKRGALLFGLSDKPDEASTPTTELAAQGYQPIHRTETHVVGE
jgi:hypothetical protein